MTGRRTLPRKYGLHKQHTWLAKEAGGSIAGEAAGKVKKAQAVRETLKLRKVSLCFYLFPMQVFPSCSLRYWLMSIPKSKSLELREPGAVYKEPFPFGKRAFSNWEVSSSVHVRCQGHDRLTERECQEFPWLSAFWWSEDGRWHSFPDPPRVSPIWGWQVGTGQHSGTERESYTDKLIEAETTHGPRNNLRDHNFQCYKYFGCLWENSSWFQRQGENTVLLFI